MLDRVIGAAVTRVLAEERFSDAATRLRQTVSAERAEQRGVGELEALAGVQAVTDGGAPRR